MSLKPSPSVATPEEIARLKSQGLSYRQIGEQLGLSKDKTQKLGRKALAVAPPPPLELPAPPEIPPELTVEGDRMVISDLHVETAEKALVEKVRDIGVRLGIKHVTIVGDILTLDCFSSYPKLFASMPFQQEVKGCRAIFQYWLTWYDDISACRGNHDERVMRKFEGEFDMEMLGDLILPGEDRGKLVMSPHDHVWFKTNNTVWLLTHSKEYSKQPLIATNRLAQKYQCNVLMGHQHHAAMGMDSYGRYALVDLPCMCADAMYKAMNTNSFPEWKRGFGAFKDGAYLPYVEGLPIGLK